MDSVLFTADTTGAEIESIVGGAICSRGSIASGNGGDSAGCPSSRRKAARISPADCQRSFESYASARSTSTIKSGSKFGATVASDRAGAVIARPSCSLRVSAS